MRAHTHLYSLRLHRASRVTTFWSLRKKSRQGVYICRGLW